jgi:hypothetical protein
LARSGTKQEAVLALLSNGCIASGAGSWTRPTGSLGTATVTLSSPQKSTPFCEENTRDVPSFNEDIAVSIPASLAYKNDGVCRKARDRSECDVLTLSNQRPQ